jgi:glutamate-1-semialdehyde 2,1-aminomutase
VQAGRKMREDGWWHGDPELSNKSIKRSILREMLSRRNA